MSTCTMCQQEFTSSTRSPSSARELLRRRLRLANTFLLGSSSLSESRMMDVDVFPPILLSTKPHVQLVVFTSKKGTNVSRLSVVKLRTEHTDDSEISVTIPVNNWETATVTLVVLQRGSPTVCF